MTHREVANRILRLAHRQHGVVARRQLLALDVPGSAIDSRIRNRTLIILYAGVYAVGHDALTQHGRWMAAILAGGPHAVLSHRSAAALLGLLPPVEMLEVIRSSSPDPHRLPPSHASRAIHPGLIIHRTRSMGEDEITVVDGIRTTDAIRTIINLAEREGVSTLRRAIREAIRCNLLPWSEFLRALSKSRGRRGISKLRHVVEEWAPSEIRTRSSLEDGFLALCREHGIPAPLVNDELHGFEVDFQWKGSNLVVETDGGTFHRDRRSRGRDYRKDIYLQSRGCRVVRLDERMVFPEAASTAALIKSLLGTNIVGPEGEPARSKAPSKLPSQTSPQTVAVNDLGPP